VSEAPRRGLKELPLFAQGAYRQLSKTAIFLALCDMLAETNGAISLDDLHEHEIVAEVNRRAGLVRNAGWSTGRTHDSPRPERRRKNER